MSDEICPGCSSSLRTPTDRHLQMCASCAERLGVTVMQKSRRPPNPCRGCSGMHFIRAVPREIAPQVGNEMDQVVAPMAVTYGATVADFAFIPKRHEADPRKGYGVLEIFICRACGLVEWYCADPEHVPIGPHYMTEDIDYGTRGPYR